MEERSKSLIKNTIILSFGNFLTKGIMFFMTPLFTRWISQSDYGVFDLILTYISLIIPIITLESSEAVFRFLADKKPTNNSYRVIVTNSLLINLFGIVLCSMIGIVLGVVFNNFYFFCLILLLSIFEGLNTYLNMLVRGLKKIDIYTISNISFCIFMVISVTFFVKIINLDLNGMFIGYFFAYFLNVIFISLIVKPYKFIDFSVLSKKEIKSMLEYSIPLIPTVISWWIILVSDRTIVSIFLGTSVTAILAIANKIPNLCQTIFNVFHFSWQQNAIETKNDVDKKEYYNLIFNKMIKTLSSIVILIMAFDFIIFYILFDERYFLAYYQAPILMISIIFSMMSQFIGGIYIADMNSKKNGYTILFASIVNLVVHLMLIKFLGLYAASISTLISYILLFFVRYKDIKTSVRLHIDKENIIVFLIILYFAIGIFINNIYMNVFNLILSILFCYFFNKIELHTMFCSLLNYKKGRFLKR
ncbi:MAG: oligosaccharide flippase family protein [Erysipelotrichales bacterium]|nr:oligosaccharide flippase family protein [Erysipelotrichales bacterium]